MTRETKIGLLVGLAFIIVIGILLSDQLMRSTEPPAAPRAAVAENVRMGTATPVSNHPPVTQVAPVGDASPEAAVPMRDEIVKRPPPVTFVEIKPGGVAPVQVGGAGTEQSNVVVGPAPVKPTAGQAGAQKSGAVATGPGPVPYVMPVPPADADGKGKSLTEVAAQFGETLVGPDGLPLRAKQPSGAKPAAGPVGMKQYTVESGDSLSRIALRQMGANTKANRDAIVKANPSLQENPDKVVIGQTYNIPVVGTAAAAGGAPVSSQEKAPEPAEKRAQPQQERSAHAQQAGAAAKGEYVYTVREGDSLWKIAKEQCGDAGAVSAIKELNRDVLKGDTVVVNSKLRLPARPVASLR